MTATGCYKNDKAIYSTPRPSCACSDCRVEIIQTPYRTIAQEPKAEPNVLDLEQYQQKLLSYLLDDNSFNNQESINSEKESILFRSVIVLLAKVQWLEEDNVEMKKEITELKNKNK